MNLLSRVTARGHLWAPPLMLSGLLSATVLYLSRESQDSDRLASQGGSEPMCLYPTTARK